MVAYTKPQQRKKEECEEKREIRSSLLILDLKGIIIVTILPKSRECAIKKIIFLVVLL